MLRSLLKALMCVVLVGVSGVFARVTTDVVAPVPLAQPGKKVSVLVIPVRDQIDEPIHYILRRGLKEGADVVVLDMKTPGGSAGTALEMMEALNKFPGKTITFVNTEAMSAGAFIAAATEEIWFTQDGVIGAAAAVTSEGQDIPETMRLKINSFLRAKIRALSEGKGYRGEVVSAMIDKDFELKIGDKVLKNKGELLSLTATEAAKTYGEPPQPLLAAGIAKDIDELLTKKFGAGNYEKRTFEVTWSEQLAQYLNLIKPILLGLGLLALFIEFKTPGFGIFGVSGIVLLAVVFLSSYVAGLSGHEPILVFAVGVVLVALELAFFHTGGVLGVVGIMMMSGSLLWAMADIWPNQPISVAWSSDLLLVPLQNMLIALVVAGGSLALIARFLPHGWIWQRLAVGGAVSGAGVATTVLAEQESLVGREGIAATSLFPSGQVEIDGRRHEARLEVGFIEAGTPIRVVRTTDFGLVVEEKKAMTTVIILFVAGVLLVAVEILVPGAILGILGGLCLLGGVIAAFVQLGGTGGVIAIGVALAISALTLYLEFVILPKSRIAKKFSMTETVSSQSQPAVADRAAVVGREAVAVTTLAPSGYVELEGRRYEAFCQSGLVASGARLRIVDVDTFRLVVTQIKESL